MTNKLKVDNNFTPCPLADGDEMYPNGIFVFNITKRLEYIHSKTHEIILEEVSVSDFYYKGSINESHMDSVEISYPVIIAEISPGRYNLIDGHHRIEKARRMGIKKLSAYRPECLSAYKIHDIS